MKRLIEIFIICIGITYPLLGVSLFGMKFESICLSIVMVLTGVLLIYFRKHIHLSVKIFILMALLFGSFIWFVIGQDLNPKTYSHPLVMVRLFIFMLTLIVPFIFVIYGNILRHLHKYIWMTVSWLLSCFSLVWIFLENANLYFTYIALAVFPLYGIFRLFHALWNAESHYSQN